MQVFAVIWSNSIDDVLVGIFSTEEAARKYINYMMEECEPTVGWDYQITPHNIIEVWPPEDD